MKFEQAAAALPADKFRMYLIARHALGVTGEDLEQWQVAGLLIADWLLACTQLSSEQVFAGIAGVAPLLQEHGQPRAAMLLDQQYLTLVGDAHPGYYHDLAEHAPADPPEQAATVASCDVGVLMERMGSSCYQPKPPQGPPARSPGS